MVKSSDPQTRTHFQNQGEELKMKSRLIAINEGKNSRGVLQFLLVFLGLIILCWIASMHRTSCFFFQNAVPVAVAQSKMIPCFQEQLSLKKLIKTPNLVHQMNDSQLFRTALLVPQARNYPFRSVRKIAFMFLTRGPLPHSPLWDKFFKGHEKRYSIYIHSLPSYKPDFCPSSAFYGRQIPSQVTAWGDVNMIDAEKRLLASALLDESNEWFVLLSEACIPLRNFSIVYDYLSRSRFSFLESFDDPGRFGRGQFNYNNGLAPEINITNWQKGSQWFEVNRKLTVDIINDTLYYSKFKKYCKDDCYCDEHYFQTMLTMKSPQLLANRSVTWTDWSRGGPHPATFGGADMNQDFFKRIADGQDCMYNNQPNSICFLFGRKFAPSALTPMLENSSVFFWF